MKKHIHNIGTYTALILLSAIPISFDVMAESKNELNSMVSAFETDKDALEAERETTDYDR